MENAVYYNHVLLENAPNIAIQNPICQSVWYKNNQNQGKQNKSCSTVGLVAILLKVVIQKKGHKKGHKKGQRNRLEKSKVIILEFPTLLVEEVYKAIRLNCNAKYSWLADNLGVSEATIKRSIADLKKLGYINSEHSKIKGEWQLLK